MNLIIILMMLLSLIVGFMFGSIFLYYYHTLEYRRALKRINKKIINNDKRYIINDTR